MCAAMLAVGLLTVPAARADEGARGGSRGASQGQSPGQGHGLGQGLGRSAVDLADGLAAGSRAGGVGWAVKATGTDARFRGLAAVNRSTAWVSGSKGTVLRTADGGRSWQNVSPPGAQGLELRDIEAFDARRAVALSIGEGEDSRIFRTEDAGATWTESFRNPDPRAFYDCLTFFDARHGLAMSDPVDGRFRILSTRDGGRSWNVLPNDGMPTALAGEAGFAASGQCLVSSGPRDVWLATGGGAVARVMHSGDRGLTWTVTDAPVPGGDPAKGVFGLAFRGGRGLAVGGDYRTGQPSPQAAATTADTGRTWRPSSAPPAAYRSGVAWLPFLPPAALTVGPTGTDITLDGGRTWWPLGDEGSFDTVDCTDTACWAAGEKGRVGRLEVR